MHRAILTLSVVLFATAFLRDRFDDWVEATALPPLVSELSTEVRDRNGRLLRAYTVEDGRWRLAVRAATVDQTYIDMLVGYEDKRFFQHAGVDLRAMARAAWQAMVNRRIVSGGSTLTMQVARLLENSGTGRWGAKLRQVRLALALERQLGKDRILSLYLHHAPFGGNIEGVRAATLAWFGKEPARLTPAEAALLVALPQAPEARRPDRHPATARAARDRVLDRLARDGLLSASTVDSGKKDAVPLRRVPFPRIAPHLADRAKRLANGRQRVDVTLNRDRQVALEALAETFITGRGPHLSVAIMVADHTTGEVIASVGSPTYSETDGRPGFIDMTRAARSPGSTLKPLVYGLAFDRGLAHPETLIRDELTRFGTYAPRNFDGLFRGEIRLSQALQLSLNVPAVKLANAVGPANLMVALRATGATPVIPGGKPGLAAVLGGVGMTMEDLVKVYAMLAQNGVARGLKWRMEEKPAAAVRIMGAASAWQVGNILAGLVPPPTAGPVGRVAYKTGTSYGHRDAWAIGYDGQFVAAVWVGRPDGTPVPGAFGADLAAPLLFEALGRVRTKPVPLPAPPPDTLLLSNAMLPEPLQRFDRRDRVQAGPPLDIIFPPDGARLEPVGGTVVVKLENGTSPFAVLRDDRAIATGLRTTEIALPMPGVGFTTLSVIDAAGQSDRVTVELR